MIVLSEAQPHDISHASARDLVASTEAARLAGCQLYTIEPDFSRCQDAEGALGHIPEQLTECMGWWCGYIPALERYEKIYEAAKARHILLLNTPEEHARVLEGDQGAQRLEGLTPPVHIIDELAQCERVWEALGGEPVFVKGAVQSRKAKGLEACRAESLEQLRALAQELLLLPSRTRGRALVKPFIELRHERTGPGGFALGREFRVVVYRGRVLGWGYYWEGTDSLARLSASERAQVLGLAQDAARSLSVPLCGVDVGQDVHGRWWVIETNDPQFSGTSQIPRLALWHQIASLG